MAKTQVRVIEKLNDIDQRFAQLLLWFELNKNNGDFAVNDKYHKVLEWLRKASKYDKEQKAKIYHGIILHSINDAYINTRPFFEDVFA